jgi:IS1 family transposase
MNKLSIEKHILILQSLCEGNSIRSIERITNTHRDTITRILVSAGNKAQEIMDSTLVNLKCNEIQCDEIWTFVAKKRSNQLQEEKKNTEIGDQWIFVALDAQTKLVPAFCVGKRNAVNTDYFIGLLKEKVVSRFQLSTDSFHCYPVAVDNHFPKGVDYAQINKIYKEEYKGERRYSPAKILKINKEWIQGEPKENKVSTSFVERQNLTMRMQMRRFTRLTNAFSKKLDNLKSACSLHFFYYNFIRVHQSLRVTPCMEAKVTNHIWNWKEFLLSSINHSNAT